VDIGEITGQWDPAALPRNVRLGEHCYLENKNGFERFFSERDPGLVLGDGVVVYTWTSFSVERAGLVEVGDGTILVGAQFMCAEHIRIGRRVVVSYNVTIADSDFHPFDPDLRREDIEALTPGSSRPRPPLASAPVIVDDDVWIGIGALILKGVHIGSGARIQAGSVVTRDVPPHATIAGNPGRPIGHGESP
jgi:acetyltransferase-like isoleucine patch superfamily enzyme